MPQSYSGRILSASVSACLLLLLLVGMYQPLLLSARCADIYAGYKTRLLHAVPGAEHTVLPAVSQSEGQTLISALGVALSNCRVAWPAFVPVHDALRDAVAGIAAVGRRSVILHADGMPALRTPKQPPELLQVREWPSC